MKYLLTVLLAAFLASCAPKFSVVPSTNSKIADPKTQDLYIGQNNSIATSTNKISLNPLVVKDKSTSKVQKCGIEFSSLANGNYIFGQIKNIEIMTNDGKTIKLSPTDYRANPKWIWRNDSKVDTGDTVETCFVNISTDDMSNVANNGIESLKIEGEKRNFTFGAEQIPSTFVENLQQFYTNYVN